MKHDHEKPVQSRQPADSETADKLRELIAKAGLSQRAAARELGVDERTVRYWCAGDHTAPRMALRALDPKLAHRQNLKRIIAGNEQQIELLESGKMTLNGGPKMGTASQARAEARRLRQKNEEHRALLRAEEAFDRRQQAFFAVNQQFLPHGSGAPSEESIDDFDAAECEWREAEQEMERIVKEIRQGLR